MTEKKPKPLSDNNLMNLRFNLLKKPLTPFQRKIIIKDLGKMFFGDRMKNWRAKDLRDEVKNSV